MKKLILISLSLVMLFAFTACTNNRTTGKVSSNHYSSNSSHENNMSSGAISGADGSMAESGMYSSGMQSGVSSLLESDPTGVTGSGGTSSMHSSSGTGKAFATAGATLKNGTYRAEETNYNTTTGYKDYVEMTVSGGKITKVTWDAISQNGNTTRKAASKAGTYTMEGTMTGMKWHEQAEALERALIETQDPTRISTAGVVSGVNMDTSVFIRLAEECIAKARK